MKLAILTLLGAGLLGAQPATIDGTVVNQKTGEALSGVHIRLATGNFNNGGVSELYGAMSDKAGHFSVANLKPGFYLVLLERAGFVQAPPNTPGIPFQSFTVKAGQHLADFKLEMNARAMIAGRVVNEYGDPVQNVFVQVESPPPVPPPANPFGNQNVVTDDRGEFRILTGPGKFYLRATLQGGGQRPMTEIRTDGTSATTYVSTYCPSAPDKGAATVVEAGAGQDVTGIEIRLTSAVAGHGSSISGVISGTPENGRASVILAVGEKSGQFNTARGAAAGPDGKFSFTGLDPGYYRVSAQYSSGKTMLQSQAVDVRLAGGDENVQLALAPGEELSGTLAVVGDGPAGGAQKRTVRLETADPFSYTATAMMTPGEVDKDGAFRIANVPPGRFRVVVEPMPENAYVQSVTLDGTAAADMVLDLSHGARGSRAKVTISRDGAEISGKLLDKDGEPEVNPLIMVFLVTDAKQMLQQAGMNRASDGKYDMKGNRPGKYRIVAIDMLHLMSGNGGTPEQATMDKLFEMAEEIELKAGDRVVKNLKAIDKVPGMEAANAPRN
jgi:hypothetical protein